MIDIARLQRRLHHALHNAVTNTAEALISAVAGNDRAGTGLRLQPVRGMVCAGCRGSTRKRWLQSTPKAVVERAFRQ